MEITIMITIYVLVIAMFGFRTWLSVLNYQYRNQPIPEEVQDVYDPEKYQKWHKYYMTNFRFTLITRTFSTVVFLIFLLTRFYVFLNDVATQVFDNARLQILFFLLLYIIVDMILSIGFEYYDTFTIEEKYGFNKSTKKTFFLDKLKQLLLFVILGGGFVFLLIVINDHAGTLFFLYVWMALIVIILIFNILYVKLIVPIFNTLTPLEDGDLKNAIFSLAESVGYEVTSISIMDASRRSSRLNAYFSGFGKFKKIILYDTLIDKMSTDEIVAVLAHEIGHNKHKHIWKNLGLSSVILFAYIMVFALMVKNPIFSTAFGFDQANFGFSIILFFMIGLPIIDSLLGPISTYLSRVYEYQADNFAATHASKEAMIEALKTISRENFANLTPHPLFVKLRYSHPPTADRIAAIRKVESK